MSFNGLSQSYFSDDRFGNNSDSNIISELQDRPKKCANELDGKTWLRYSISIWSDIRKSSEESDLHHPAIFPISLASRLIEIFTNSDQHVIVDPFAGMGSTIIAARNLGKQGIGIELNPNYVEKARKRLETKSLLEEPKGNGLIYHANALNILQHIAFESVDLVITSPPYWDILSMKRSADYKAIRDYGNESDDLGKIEDYNEFLKKLADIFSQVFQVLRPSAYCCVIVMDIRKKNKFYPFHSDLSDTMQSIGFVYDDLIIWDRRHEYNNMRPLGYPSVFRVNKAHEFILIFQKPRQVCK